MIARFVIDITDTGDIVVNRYNQYGINVPLVFSVEEAKARLTDWAGWETETMQTLVKEVTTAIQLIEEEQNAVRS